MDDTQRLLVSLEARVTKYERDFERATRATNDNFKKIENRAKQSATNLEKSFAGASASISEKLEGLFKPFLAGGIVAAGVAGAATAVKEIADSVAEVDREARKAGVSSKVWQQWTYVAKATGMEIDGVTDALKELNIRGDEFARTGKGSAEEAFQRLGYTAADVAERLKDPNRFLDEIIGKLQKLDAAAQTRILDEVFGGTGAEQLAKVLGLSVAQIQKLRSEAATFSEEQIEAAKKIDAEFETLWRNVSVYAKKAAINSVGYAGQIIDTLSTLKGDKLIARDREAATDPEAQMKRLLDQRAKIAAQISDLQANPFDVLKAGELRQLEAALKAVDEQIADIGGGSDELKAALSELSNATQSFTRNLTANTNAAANFKTALAELKSFIPGLKAELDTLATTSGIDAAYQRAVQNARTMGEIMNATDIANRAKTASRFGNHDNILDLVASVESGGDYNATLDNGRWTGGAQNLTAMTLDQVRALQRQMIANSDNRALYGDGKGSSALGRYQITGATLDSLIKELGLTGDRLFDQTTQDELARALLRRRGNDPDSLRQEWTGLRRVDDSTIRDTFANTPTAKTKLDPTPGQQKAIDLAKQQDEARKGLNRTVQEGLDLARFEQSISSMSASQQRIELAVYQAQQEAKRNGITLSDQELSKIREKISLTAQLDTENKKVSASSQGLKNAQQYFAESFTSSLSGLLTGTQSLNGALQNLLNSLVDATLQAALLGKGPLAGLFGGGSGIFGSIFGFADGGYTGRGGKYEPAGVVHRGEYVMSAAATRKIGVGNLEALHTGALKGFASGGYVGPKVTPITAANQNAPTFTQAVNITAPVTVNASGGTPAQNADLAKQVSKEVNASLRAVVIDELNRQMKPGNMLSRGRGR
ncbi:phage tail tape measure protein [Rhizobium sp. BK661]|uniref:phage tail tape measure protein n=1 Tax=Rhizobium sp. BK661 TaxID=2586991 RepID=UPI002169300D|nr:phage tail tape measure protein [Rhizobium sp. BK661]MCS3740225.1 hypothetical protein [Rhizobium sp. BK661]